MIIDLDWFVAILGCVALFIFWMWHRASGMRGFVLLVIGMLVIIGALLYEQDASGLPYVVGIALAGLVLTMLLFTLGKLMYARKRHMPRYQAPSEMNGRCSACARQTYLKHYEQGWLCAMCAHHIGAKAA